jgi:hypothetical protein
MFVENGEEKPIKELLLKDLADLSNKTETIEENYMKNLIRKIILEEEEEKTLKMKDWDEIFSFQKVDEKESGKYTDVKIKMDSVMDRMPHWRKKYKKQCEDIDNCDDDGEDDSFVRAVIDTHPEVVRVLFTKGMAHLTSSDDQEDLNERAKAAAFIGTLQASYTDFHYLRDIWKRTTEKDALIGVGMTGIASGAVLKLNMKIIRKIMRTK